MYIELTQKEADILAKQHEVDDWDNYWFREIAQKFFGYTKRYWERAIDLERLDKQKSSFGTKGGFLDLSTPTVLVGVDFWVEKKGEFPFLFESMGKSKMEEEDLLLEWAHEKDPDDYMGEKDLVNQWTLNYKGHLSLMGKQVPSTLLKSIFGTQKIKEVLLQVDMYKRYKGKKPKPRRLGKEETQQLSKIIVLLSHDSKSAIELAIALDLMDNLADQVISPNLYKRKIEL